MSTLALPTNAAAGPSRPLGLALPGVSGAAGRSNSPLAPSQINDASDQRSSLVLPTIHKSSTNSPSKPAAAAVQPNRSPSIDLKEVDPEEEDGDDEDDEDLALGKKKKGGGGGTKKKAGAGGADGKNDYKYSSEISQMMFVFGEVQDPSQETVRLVEDIVRGQIIEIVTRARLLTHLRSSRFLSAEDLIFLIRDDRGKVNRLRTYLSWKDVRKRAKEEEEGDLDVDEAEKAAPKGRKSMVKLPWELLTPFGDFLRNLPNKQQGQGRGGEDEDEEDEDEMQAYHDSMQRLKDADEITKKMTKDEYVHYSDCRQASFTYRKARRFRDFVNFGAYLDVRPNDDIVDILGFLSFEMVRSLCVTALEVRDRFERRASLPSASTAAIGSTARKGATAPRAISPKRKQTQSNITTAESTSPPKKHKTDNAVTTVTMVTSPEPVTPHPALPAASASSEQGTARKPTAGGGPTAHSNKDPVSLFAAPPSARQPLLPSHVLEAFAQIQREQAANRTKGLGNWRGAPLGRGRIALV